MDRITDLERVCHIEYDTLSKKFLATPLMSIQLLSTEKQELSALHDDFGHKVLLTGCCTAAASFLIIGALIVITCGCLCLMLPGINVVTHIILPAVVPGLCAIVASIPFIILAVRHSRDKNFVREQTITRMISLMDTHEIPEKSEKERVRFILHNLLDWRTNLEEPDKIDKNTDWTIDYQKKILGDIKEMIGKDKKERNARQERIAEAIDKALTKLQQKKKK